MTWIDLNDTLINLDHVVKVVYYKSEGTHIEHSNGSVTVITGFDGCDALKLIRSATGTN